MSIVSSAYDNFISGPTAQSTSNNWQYFEINSDRSIATLLPNWQNGNDLISTYGQWDSNRFSGNYPFIQKVTGSGTISSGFGSSFTGPALIMHPDDNSIYNICLGYKNNTASTITATVDISLSLLYPDRNNDGVNYYIHRGLVNGTRYLSYVSSSIPHRSTSTFTFTNSSIELQTGELIYLTINKNSSFSYDHARVGFTVTSVAKPSPTYNSIPQVSKTIGVDASFSLATVMIGASNSSGAYTFSSTSTSISISGDVATILEYTPSAVTVNASQASTETYNAGSTTFSLMVSLGTPTLSSATFTVSSTSKVYGDPSFAILTRPTSNSSGTITYTSNNPAVATIDASGDWINIVGVGDVSFNALQAAVPNQFTTASRTSSTLTVSKGTPTLAFVSPPSTKTITDASFSVSATSASAGAVSYSSSDISLATVHPSTGSVTLKGIGSVTITASQTSTALYNSPSNATCSISIQSAGTALQGTTVTSGTSFAALDLSGASLVGTTVSGVSFSGANLSNVDFSGAVIVGTDFTNVNLSGATNLPAFSPVQKLQLLKNINNKDIGQVQVTEPLSGSVINDLVDIPSDIINNATFVVAPPSSIDGSGNKVVTVSVSDISGDLSVYIPLNPNESAKINDSVYLFDGTNILDTDGNAVNFITISGTPFKVYAGSIVAVNVMNAINKTVISFPDGLTIGLYDLVTELFALK